MSEIIESEVPPIVVGARNRGDRAALAAKIASLEAMTYADLRCEWRRLYRSDAPKKLSRDLLELGIAWKLQEQALGGLSVAMKRQLDELARTMDAKSNPTKTRKVTLKPGARLIREWGGETHEVAVVEDGFVWRDKTWRSLSAIAREITGAHWSGPRFFGLSKAKSAPRCVVADETEGV
ncbi:MAG: DUF2924 domain-containing protein [Hyphomicrobiales bacterium]|nr:DUF2924 domain-containing protein [Hyphomicrobiales bacterium]